MIHDYLTGVVEMVRSLTDEQLARGAQCSLQDLAELRAKGGTLNIDDPAAFYCRAHGLPPPKRHVPERITTEQMNAIYLAGRENLAKSRG